VGLGSTPNMVTGDFEGTIGMGAWRGLQCQCQAKVSVSVAPAGSVAAPRFGGGRLNGTRGGSGVLLPWVIFGGSY
jgi:hypothetical protein